MGLSRLGARRALAVILFAGALFRLIGLNWDAGHHLHPDERFISMVEEKLLFPSSVAEYFDSARSPMNPYNRGHGSFVYGTLPMFVTKAIAQAIGKDGYGAAHLVGRVLSALADLLSVWLAYVIARRLSGGRLVGLAAAALLAFAPLGIQLSHFWNVDTFLTAFSTAALLGCVRVAQGRSGILEIAGIGVAIGLAVACKVTALALLLPLGLGILIGVLRDGLPRSPRAAGVAVGKAAGRFAVALLPAAIALRVALPYAFAGPSVFSFRLDARYLADMKRLVELAASVAGFPPALHWAGRTFLYPLTNFFLWNAGPLFALTAIAALVWAIVVVWKRPWRVLAPLAAYALFLVLYHGTATAKAGRYFYPAYPTFAVLAALFLAWIAARARERAGVVRWLARAAPAVAVAGTFVWALGFTSIYRRPHTRVEASRWIHANVPAPARFANEAWDDGLPLSFPGYDSSVYSGPSMDLYGPDTREKVEQIVGKLQETDWIAVTSNRVYANITRLPAVFPMTTAYYRGLFEGGLGFERAADFRSYPSLGPIQLPDDRAEELFTVYDHPRVLLFRKTKSFSPDRVRAVLTAALPKTSFTIWDWEKQPAGKRHVGTPLVPSRGEAQRPVRAARAEEASSLGAAIVWYAAILLVGLVALPLAWAAFPRLADRGAGMARILGLVATTFLLSLLLQLRVLPNGRGAAWVSLFALALVSAAVYLVRRSAIVGFLREKWRLLAAGEIAFGAGFVLFLGIRALNPEIYWGEKPMDFSILNALVRTRALPASDPWFAGAPLGYYAFGHQMIALLTQLTGLSTRFTFNLAFGLLGGLMLQGSFTLLRNWTGTLRGGIAGAGLVTILGNLSGLREWLVNDRKLDWHYFWATSRVIKDTINEYPLWNLIFADLHAHVLAMPVFLLVAAAALHFVRVHSAPPARLVSRLISGALLGFAAAAQALTNAWDTPMLAGIIVLVLLTAATAAEPFWTGLRRLLPGAATALAAAGAAAAALWVRGGRNPAWGWEHGAGAKGMDVLTVFGLFFFLAFVWLLSYFSDRMAEQGLGTIARVVLVLSLAALLTVLGFLSVEVFCAAGILLFLAAAGDRVTSPEERLACGFVAAAFVLVLIPQRIYISDRMNTFFKLYLEAWLLLAVATAALVFRPRDKRGSLPRWPLPARGIFVVLALAALFTTVTAARGAVTNHFAAYSGPSLDGLRYLEESRPGEYRAVMWLRQKIAGTPVVLEAQGDSYQDFGRISMLTGLPTVLGWEHHVKQRGNPEEEVLLRRDAVRQIYSSTDAAAIEKLLRRFHVGYVYVGWLERKTYPAEGLRKFDSAKDLFEVAYENRDATVYRVVGGDSEDVIAPAREALPEPPPGQPVVEEEEAPPSFSETPEEGRPAFSGMREPRDAALDERGRLWIADFGNNRLRLFDAEGGYLGGWGGRGSGTFQLREPCGVAIRGEDLYIADTWNGRVTYFTASGEWKATAAGLYGPRGVAVAPDGRVWIADTGNHRVLIYDKALAQSTVVGKQGKGSAEFSAPIGIAADDSGLVYVVDSGNNRVQVLDSTGAFRRAIPVDWRGQAVEPHVEVAPKGGSVYVTDPAGEAVLEFSPSGERRRSWTQDAEGVKFARPTGLALDPKRGTLYVINSANNRVSRLEVGKP